MATIRLPTSGSMARAANKCSAPKISVVSPNTDVAPNSTSRSLATPSAGFAVIPESASEPPHSRPSTIALHGAGTRSTLCAASRYSLATVSASCCNFSIDPHCASEIVVNLSSPNDCAPSIIACSSGEPIVKKMVA